MIPDVDESLRTVVRRDVLDGANVEISFEAPTRDWAARRNSPTLSLYLYEIREDLQRREVQIEERRGPEGVVIERRLSPRKFKLSYLITAWTQRPEDEHRLLSAVLSCFIAFDALPLEVLQGELAQQPEPIRVTIGLPRPPDRPVSDVWTALGGELKASLDLIVTAPLDTGRRRHVGPPVQEEPRISFSGSKGHAERVGGNGGPPGGQAAEAGTSAEGAGAGDDQAGEVAGPKGKRGRSHRGEDAAEHVGVRPPAEGVAAGPPGAVGPPDEAGPPVGASEVVHAGKNRSGRTFGIRTLPRQ
jgi:Pvc16 N-terminal domain